jgi:hypothetical protein
VAEGHWIQQGCRAEQVHIACVTTASRQLYKKEPTEPTCTTSAASMPRLHCNPKLPLSHAPAAMPLMSLTAHLRCSFAMTS